MNLKLTYLFIVCSLLFSCKSKNEFDIENFLRRWKFDYVELNGKRIDNLKGENAEFDYEFLKDNSYIIYSPTNESGKGNWELNEQENCVYIRNHKNEIYGKIFYISENRIIVIPTSKIGSFPELELAKYYYVPK